MLFLHGGNFQSGGAGGKLYDGRFIANMSEVVVVVTNYRLGKVSFVFLSYIAKARSVQSVYSQFVGEVFL